MDIVALYKTNGIYSYGGSGFHRAGLLALFVGVLAALIGYWVPSLDYLYKMSWFTDS